MAEENKTIDENLLSEPFQKLSRLPAEKEKIKDEHKEEAKKLFADIVESVKNGHAVTIAEYNLLSRIRMNYDFIAFLKTLKENERLEVASQVNIAGNRKIDKIIEKFAEPINTTSVPDRKKEIKKRIAALNDALATSNGNFTDEHIKKLQDAITEFSTFKGKKRNAKTGEEVEKTYTIPVQTYFADFKPTKGKKVSSAFTVLYEQVYQGKEPEVGDVVANRLETVADVLGAGDADEQEQKTTATQPENGNQEDAQQPEGQNEHKDEPQPEAHEEPEVQPQQPEITVTDKEIDSYLSEIKASDNEDNYLKSINPKISVENIEAVMNIEETKARYATILDEAGNEQIVRDEDGNPAMTLTQYSSAAQNRAAAVAQPDDMLVAFKYYADKLANNPNDADAQEKLSGLKDVIAHNLTEIEASAITPDNAYVYALLAEKVQDSHPDKYKASAEKIAIGLKSYDAEHFGSLNDKQLSDNYGAVMKGLEGLNKAAVLAMLSGYTFTDDDGKKLEDKNRGILNPARITSGKGNKLSDTQERIIETARLMAAEELAKEGMPAEKKDANGKVITVEQQLLNKMQEKIGTILYPAPTDDILNAAELLVQKTKPELNKNPKEYDKAVKLNVISLMAGDEETLKAAVAAIAEKQGKAGDAKAEAEIKAQLKQTLQQSKTFDEKEMGARFAAYTTELEQFKKRINQKPDLKDGSLHKRVTPLLKQLDEKLTERYQEKYTTPKGFLQTYGKMAVGSAKSAGLFAAASFIPGAVPALIARNTYKQIKSMKKEMQNPEYSAKQKAWMWTAVAVTTALAATSFVPGVGGVTAIAVKTLSSTGTMLLPNYFKKQNLKRQKKRLAEHRENLGPDGKPTAEALKQHKEKVDALKSSIADVKELAENGGVGQFFNNMLGRNKRKLDKLNKELEVLEKDAPKTLADIIAAEKAVDLQNKKNNREMTKKAAGVAIGMLVGQTVNAAVHDSFEADQTETDNPKEQAAQDKPAEQNQDTAAKTETPAKAENESTNPDDLHGAKAPEGLTAEEQKAQNLAAAEEKGSGHIGKSDMESMQKDLDSKDGAKLDYTAEEKAALMKSLAEGFGKESYEAMHAAMAEPRILAAQMGITADVEASAQAAGINPATDYSKAVLNHLATHPELADNEGFKAYVAEHFDAQDRFHSSNYSVHVETHAPSAQPDMRGAKAPEAPHETKITYTPVDHLPGERPAPQPETPPVQHEPQQPVYTGPVIPPHGIAVNGVMAYVNGQEYHQSMEFSNKLGYTLNDRAILGVYQNNQNPDDFVMITAPLDRYGQPIPDGRLTATHHTYEYLRDAQEQAHTGFERVDYKMQPGLGYYSGHNVRICQGTGIVSQTDLTYAKVSASAHVAGNIAYTVGNVLEAIGENGKGAYKAGTISHGVGDVTAGIGALNQILGKGRG